MIDLQPGTQFRTPKYVGTILAVSEGVVTFKENGSIPHVRRGTLGNFARGITAGLIELIDPTDALMDAIEVF